MIQFCSAFHRGRTYASLFFQDDTGQHTQRIKETLLHIPALLLANIDQAACDVFTSLLDP